ncbi:MAG TPA: DUF1404 family protein [Nitrososphaerales archaeon]|nr:DUF1404 family protein [Nitrososphaerales archaeon]
MNSVESNSTQVSLVNTRHFRLVLIGLLGTLLLLTEPVDAIVDANLTLHMFQHIALFCLSMVFGYGLERILVSKLLQLKRITYVGWRAFTWVMRFNSKTRGLIFAAVIPAIAFSFWHFPPNFDLAEVNNTAHALEHLCYIVSGSLVGLSIVAIPRKWKIVLLYFAFMQAGMMGSMMLVWPSYFPIYSASQNLTMDTALMMFGALGVIGTSSAMLKQLDII